MNVCLDDIFMHSNQISERGSEISYVPGSSNMVRLLLRRTLLLSVILLGLVQPANYIQILKLVLTINLLHHAAAYSKVKVSDTTGADSSNTVKPKIKLLFA